MFTRSRWVENQHDSLLIFSDVEPHEIGAESDDYLGKSSEDLPNVKMVMEFSKPESITALIHSLVELQKSIFKKPVL